MSHDTSDDKELSIVYNLVFEETARLIVEEKYKVQIVAATLLAQALRLYKSCLKNNDFERMINSIPDSKDNIRPYDIFEDLPTDKKYIN